MLDSEVKGLTKLSISRDSAVSALGRLGDPRAIPYLIVRVHDRKVADGDPDPQVRLYAVESLVLLGDKESRDHVLDAVNAVPRRVRNDARWRRLKEAVETGEPLTPWVSRWEQHLG